MPQEQTAGLLVVSEGSLAIWSSESKYLIAVVHNAGHTQNEPEANAQRLKATWNHAEGYTNEQLKAVSMKEMVEAIRLAVTELPVHDFNLSLRQESCPDCQPEIDECSWKSYRATQITLAKLEDAEG